jgi:hypothetical protein
VAGTSGPAPGDRRALHLGWLRALGFLATELELAAQHEAYLAAAAGANFRELGDAWGITRQGAWEDTPGGPVLRLDDGSVHTHVTGQVHREIIERGEDQ